MNLRALPAKVVRAVLRGITCTHRRMGCPGDGNGNAVRALVVP